MSPTPTRWNRRRPVVLSVFAFAAAMTIAACEPADPAVDPLAPTEPGVVAPGAPDVAEPPPTPTPGAVTEADATQIRERLDEVTARLDAVEERLAMMAETAETQELANEALEDVDQAMTILAEVRQGLDNPAAPDADMAPADPAPAAPGN